MYNNPAFQLFLMATLDAYRLGWPATESDLLLVSVGTGTSPKADDQLRPGDMNLLFNANSVPAALMYAALNEQDLLCRVFGRCRHGAPDRPRVGDLMHGPGCSRTGFLLRPLQRRPVARWPGRPRPHRHGSRSRSTNRLREHIHDCAGWGRPWGAMSRPNTSPDSSSLEA